MTRNPLVVDAPPATNCTFRTWSARFRPRRRNPFPERAPQWRAHRRRLRRTRHLRHLLGARQRGRGGAHGPVSRPTARGRRTTRRAEMVARLPAARPSDCTIEVAPRSLAPVVRADVADGNDAEPLPLDPLVTASTSSAAAGHPGRHSADVERLRRALPGHGLRLDLAARGNSRRSARRCVVAARPAAARRTDRLGRRPAGAPSVWPSTWAPPTSPPFWSISKAANASSASASRTRRWPGAPT